MAFSDSRFIAFSLIKILSLAKRGPAGVTKSLNRDPATLGKLGLFSSLDLSHTVRIITLHAGNYAASMQYPWKGSFIPIETWDLVALVVLVCCFAINSKFILFNYYQVLLKSMLKM